MHGSYRVAQKYQHNIFCDFSSHGGNGLIYGGPLCDVTFVHSYHQVLEYDFTLVHSYQQVLQCDVTLIHSYQQQVPQCGVTLIHSYQQQVL
jgi:hypothetical protein